MELVNTYFPLVGDDFMMALVIGLLILGSIIFFLAIVAFVYLRVQYLETSSTA